MCGVVAHAKFCFDDPGHPIASPHIPSEAHPLSALAKTFQQLHEFGFTEAEYRAGRLTRLQGLATPLDAAFDPLADRPLGHTERFGNQALRPMVFLMEFSGPKTAQRSPILGFC